MIPGQHWPLSCIAVQRGCTLQSPAVVGLVEGLVEGLGDGCEGLDEGLVDGEVVHRVELVAPVLP